VLNAEGYGIIQLPPADLDHATVSAWLEQVAEHVAEFRRNEYEVVVARDGVHDAALNAALGAFDMPALAEYGAMPR
jgi:hypothetical protein